MAGATPELVVDLRNCGRDSLPVAGGKGANLGELMRAGAPVPEGFVVTTTAWAAAVAGRSADEIPAAVEEQIRHAYRRLGGTVAVRSSATAEDLPGAAFAGQQDTFLGITGADAVLEAVRQCWASLWNERAIAYRALLGIDDAQVAIAVVVQRLIDAEVAGVMFTANPVTGGRDEYVIDASPGLGEAVVSGRVTPDHYLTDPAGRIRTWTAGRREVVIHSTGAGTTETTEAVPVATTADTPPDSVLPAAVVADLCRHATTVADHFGCPQDIEWAWAAGKLWLVRARPMTALPPPPQRISRLQRRLSSVLSDYLTHRPYPIDMSSWLPYGPAGMMGQIAADLGVAGVFDPLAHETDGVVDRGVIPTPRPTLRLLGAPGRTLRRLRRHDLRRWRQDPRWRGMQQLVDHLDRFDVSTLPWDELVQVPARAMAALRPLTGLRMDYLPAAGFALARLLVLARLLGRPAAVADLLSGAPTETAAMNEALVGLADLAAPDPALRRAIEAGDLATARAHPQFGPALDQWLDRFGHRETESLVLITQPTLAEEPGVVLGLVTVLLTERVAPAKHDDSADPLAALLDHPVLRFAALRSAVTGAVAAARTGVAFREDTHVAATLPMPAFRRSLAEIGRRLATAGVLDDPADVQHCRLSELVALPDPALATNASAAQDLRRQVTARRTLRDQLAGVPLFNIVDHPARADGDSLVVGTPASTGTATGTVRVIRGPAEFGKLRAGEVLTCPYTNPSWTPLFQRAAAVVVDSGGPASHAAIVAREYGIPAVMGTRDGTAILADGDHVVVDGAAGTVRAVGGSDANA